MPDFAQAQVAVPSMLIARSDLFKQHISPSRPCTGKFDRASDSFVRIQLARQWTPRRAWAEHEGASSCAAPKLSAVLHGELMTALKSRFA
jgi:hypothetical protein